MVQAWPAEHQLRHQDQTHWQRPHGRARQAVHWRRTDETLRQRPRSHWQLRKQQARLATHNDSLQGRRDTSSGIRLRNSSGLGCHTQFLHQCNPTRTNQAVFASTEKACYGRSIRHC